MKVDWYSLFSTSVPPLELAVRGSFVYLFLFILLRILVRRHVGAFSLTDFLVVVPIADASQNAMAGEYKTLSDGAVLCTTIVAWSVFLDWLSFKIPAVRNLLEPPPLTLVRDGVLIRKHMSRELISEEELLSQLRLHGIEELRSVRLACVEPDGQMSVFKVGDQKPDSTPHKTKVF